jgi:hypothetical protein
MYEVYNGTDWSSARPVELIRRTLLELAEKLPECEVTITINDYTWRLAKKYLELYTHLVETVGLSNEQADQIMEMVRELQ